MINNFIINNKILISIIIFLLFFIGLIFLKPSLVFDKYGKPREFGLGYKNKTVVPIWLIIIILSIASYLLVIYYCNNSVIF